MTDTNKFKTMLQEEQANLESELSTLGVKNPERAGDWIPTESESEIDRADETEVADTIETLENNSAIMTQLETRLAEVKDALDRIEKGTYGTCMVCNAEIEEERLEANPAASTCTMHMSL